MTADAISLLQADHRRVEELLERLRSSRSEGDWNLSLGELERVLEAHASAEEQVLYPLAESLPETEACVSHAYEEHEEARTLLRELGDLDTGDPRARTTLDELAASVAHHVKEEEGRLFPMLRQIVTDQQLVELGGELESTKQKWELAG